MLYRILLCLYLIVLSNIGINAQDNYLSHASDGIIKRNVDSIILNESSEFEEFEFVSPLYSNWVNYGIRTEGSIPATFNIDLRNFSMPTTNRLITSVYGERWGRMHNGIDIKVYIGDTIYSAFEGKVRIVGNEPKGYGKYIVIRHKNGLETVYGHLSKHIVKVNQIVKSGEPIGLGGNTGRSTGSHLHFETRLCGIAINPSLLFDFKMQDVKSDFYVFKKSENINTQNRVATLRKRRKK